MAYSFRKGSEDKGYAIDLQSLIGSVIPPGFEPGTHSLEGCCSIQLSYRTKPVRPFTKGQKNAERKGFEPLEVVSLNGFQDRRIRPLCHLSESEFAGQKHSFGVQRYCLVSFYASFYANFSTFSVFSQCV